MKQRSLAAVVALLATLGATRAQAISSATELCGAAVDPCVVRKTFQVDSGAVLDFGSRSLELATNGKLDVGAGAMVIMAGQLVMRPGARLIGKGGTITVEVGDTIQLLGSTRIDVTDDIGGRIQLVAGVMTIEGVLDADSTTTFDGGSIELGAPTIMLAKSGKLTATGGREGIGGEISVTASGAVDLRGLIDVSAGDSGGSIEISGGNVTISGKLDLQSGAGGEGASLDVDAAGNLVIDGAVAGTAGGGPEFGGGVGAEVSLVAGGSVEINAAVDLMGSGGGEGGTFDLLADGGFTQRAPISAFGRGTDGAGGEVQIAVGGLLELADIDASGTTVGNVISATTAATARLTGSLRADGDPLLGDGGVVEVRACDLDMDTASLVSTRAAGGTNLLQAGGLLVVRGTLVAGELNVLEYGDSALAPVVTGSLSPTSAPVLNPTVTCGGVRPPGATTTTTLFPAQCGGTLSIFDGLLCRLSTITLEMAGAPEGSLGKKRTAKRLRRWIAKAVRLVEAARKTTRAKKERRRLKGAARQINRFNRKVQKLTDRGKIDLAVGNRLAELGAAAALDVEQLRASAAIR